MSKFYQSLFCLGASLGIFLSSGTGLRGQTESDGAAASSLEDAVDPEPSLFVPVQPGATPRPTPTPAVPPPPEFVPAPISPPAIQSGPVTQDVLPAPEATPEATPVPTPTPTRAAKPAAPQPTPKPTPTPRKSTKPPAPKVMSMDQIRQLVSQATKSRSSASALQIAWAYYNRNEFSSAGQWFNQALEWNPRSGEAAYGLALSKFREGDLSSAEAIVNYRRSAYPKMRTLEGDIAARRAVDAYTTENYQRSLEYMDLAAKSRPLSRNEQIIRAWSLYYTKHYEQAAEIFEALYRKAPDQTTAEGLYASVSKLQDYERMDALAALPGPFEEVYATYDARQYYDASLFRAASYANGEKLYPVLQNIDSPTVAMGIGYRYKSGQSGEGKLSEWRLPAFQGAFFPSNQTMISGRLSHIMLDSGGLNDGANVGKVPKTFEFYSYDPTTRLTNLWEFAVGFEYQDWWSFYFEIGATPLNGPLVARPVGNAGIIYRDLHGYVQAEFYSKSIKESMLSYVGIRDPYSGNTWGRVTETGGSLQFFRSFMGNNTIFLKALYGYLSGTNTQSNQHVALTAALAHNFKLRGFEYLTLGPAFSFEHFQNNQNHFTYGNGGYFSPDYLFQGLLGMNFLTTEGRQWLVAGSAGAGVQTNRQAGSPYFPLDRDGREFPATNSTTAIALVSGSAAYLINSSFLIGVSGSYNVTADYNEGFAAIWLRYYFEPRNGLLRTDLSLE